MCGRYALALNSKELQLAFPEFTFPENIQARFNIAPSQPILSLSNDGTRAATFQTWGLIPSWSKDPSIGNKLINARAETLSEKPSYRGPYKYHRCLIFANGFFEWQAQSSNKGKLPYYIHLKSGEPFAFAGLWDKWQSPDGSEIHSATIITTTPNDLVEPIHSRMPVILPKDCYTQWIDPNPQPPSRFDSILSPYPSNEMIAEPISTLVNSPENDTPEVLIPI